MRVNRAEVAEAKSRFHFHFVLISNSIYNTQHNWHCVRIVDGILQFKLKLQVHFYECHFHVTFNLSRISRWLSSTIIDRDSVMRTFRCKLINKIKSDFKRCAQNPFKQIVCPFRWPNDARYGLIELCLCASNIAYTQCHYNCHYSLCHLCSNYFVYKVASKLCRIL